MTDLEVMASDVCWRHLARRVVGRVGFDLGHGPRIHPVNYRLDGKTIVLRTTDGTELARFVELFGAGSLMAFEVDEIDYEWHQGWSVLVEGRVEKVDDPDELHRLHAAWPRPWASGARNLMIRVTPVAVTGRQLGPD
jgi:nitroimidazol reductase NimA-like FMN-containing flavoprotein (pyridoxamine 5'-phosphate oxidase superfamily)